MYSFSYIHEVSYARGLALQEEAFARVQSGAVDGVLLGLRHPAVITLGRRAERANLLSVPPGVEIVQTDRGGDVTYHGPEQVILYPIVSLARAAQTVKSFACALERAMIAYLGTLGIAARREGGAPGVFVGAEKIGFLGLRVRDHVSTHGLALNLRGPIAAFSWMHPCGHASLAVTSVEQQGAAVPSHEAAARGLAHALVQLLQPAPNWRSV